MTTAIEGMSESESAGALEHLYAAGERREFIYEHVWRPGDFVMWDNSSVNHQACGGYAMDDIRLLHRTSTQGDQPF